MSDVLVGALPAKSDRPTRAYASRSVDVASNPLLDHTNYFKNCICSFSEEASSLAVPFSQTLYLHVADGKGSRIIYSSCWPSLTEDQQTRCDLTSSKCEASFSVDPHQANLQPNLLLLGSRLRFNPTPTFLGVTFDRTLSFSKHVYSLKAKFFPRLKALRCISASSWSPSKESLSLLYKSFLRSLLNYA